jgi:uncharacterized membrane protein YedE/YeeE
MTNLIFGLVAGLVFGFLLQRGGVTRYRVIVGQFLWVDHTVLRTMLTAVVVGSAGVYALHINSDVSLHIKGAALIANIVGGLIFGIGMVVLGYCPGTGVGAVGDGSRHAIFGIIGMLVGAGVFAEIQPLLKGNLLGMCDMGKITLPQVTGLSPWIFIIALAVIAVIVFAILKRMEPNYADTDEKSTEQTTEN